MKGHLSSLARWLGITPVKSVVRDLREIEEIVAQITRHEESVVALSDDALSNRAAHQRERVRDGSSSDVELIEAYALVRESARRAVGLRAFDVQLLGAIAMHRRMVAEMQTGEGKTLAAVFPAYLNALAGQGVHVLTVNDYLARRDASWMGPAFEMLGISVGCVQHGSSPTGRRAAYAADITYATANEVGFDYLRDHLCERPEDVVQRGLRFAILDEIDSILIDEARVPLVLAGGRSESDPLAIRADELALGYVGGEDYVVDREGRSVFLTEQGMQRTPDALLVPLTYALHARELVRRDVDYILRDGRIELVDEFKGRVAQRRRWPDGLHTAVEIKEGLGVTPEARILSSITLQALIRLYEGCAGMTGTAVTSADELNALYGLRVAVVPPNRPCIRTDWPDIVYTHAEAKERGLCEEIRFVHATGRPVLVGTRSVAESERLAARLLSSGVECKVLNARNEELEAGIVAEAGAIGAVTISTNMAGRGTDIRLGGAGQRDYDRVAALGGLYVIGTNRHDARRIDLQLRGRAGRQGDPGSSRFYVSLTDDLVELYGVDGILGDDWRPPHSDEPIDDPSVAVQIERAQAAIDRIHAHLRAGLDRYAVVLEEHRRVVHGFREDVLFGRAPSLLAVERAEQYEALRTKHGGAAAADTERRITLHHLDHTWAEHLEAMTELREDVQLRSVGVTDTMREYRERAAEKLAGVMRDVRRRVVGKFDEAMAMGADGGPAELNLPRPGATWTYHLHDVPAHSYTDREVIRSLLRDALRA